MSIRATTHCENKNKLYENPEPHYGSIEDPRHTAEEMDEIRQKNLAYEYLCHLEEAKIWLEAVLKEELPPPTELEENLRNGVYLAKLGHVIAPQTVPLSRIYDIEQKRYKAAGLQFRHTDNINYWRKSLLSVELPVTFHPVTTDVYEKKNMPRVFYCIHALSTHLFKQGKAPLIQDLYGKVDFTDEQIRAVSVELSKCGQQMPAFQKIGGLLSRGCAQQDEVVLAINQATSHQELAAALASPVAKLQHVQPHLVSCYHDVLSRARADKRLALANKSLNDSYVPDVYDELLTLAEIQGYVTSVNVVSGWCDAVTAAHKCDQVALYQVLSSPALQLQDVERANSSYYLQQFEGVAGGLAGELSTGERRDKLQAVVCGGNYAALNHVTCAEALSRVNAALREGSCSDLLAALSNPVLKLSALSEFAAPLYLEEMRVDRLDLGKDLVLPDVEAAVRVLTSVADISQAVDMDSSHLVWEALCNPSLHFLDLDETLKEKYTVGLRAYRREKQLERAPCPLLTYLDVQECVDVVNQQFEQHAHLISWLQQLSAAVRHCDLASTLASLCSAPAEVTSSELVEVTRDTAPLYLHLLQGKQCEKQQQEPGAELWLEDVRLVLQEAQQHVHTVQAAAASLAAVERFVQRGPGAAPAQLLELLEQLGVVPPASERALSRLHHALLECRRRKELKHRGAWVAHHVQPGLTAYIDVQSGHHVWDQPAHYQPASRFLSIKDLKSAVTYATAVCENKSWEELLVRLQACVRGYLLRRSVAERKQQLLLRHVCSAVKIQAWWRGVLARRAAERASPSHAASSDSYDMDWYKAQECKVVKVQAVWRGHMTRRVLRSLLHHPRPPLPVVRQFVHLLECTPQDYHYDMQLQALRAEVVQAIRHNQELARQLEDMDVKIGLLVHNRITLQDVVAHGTTLNQLAKQGQRSSADVSVKGLKSLTREGRKKLDDYQQLFYLLQTNPVYFSRLIVCLPQGYFSKYLQNAMFALFNYGANQRAQYLFLKLLESALHQEVRCKFEKLSDGMSGSSLVLKLTTNYTRLEAGCNSLRTILGPLVDAVLKNTSLMIETNPIEIYKFWRNSMEMETGKASELPDKVTTSEALAHEEVRTRLSQCLEALRTYTSLFLERITDSIQHIPYCMLFMAKVLRHALKSKFGQSQDKDVLKVVGNLVYYQYINSAIVAPDAFDIVDLNVRSSLSVVQRRNLASIAKILQFAATKKGYGEECHYLTCLNPFIVECHERFKQFVAQCCEVEDLEQHFRVHEFSEAMLICQPTAELSLQEMCDMHKLLLQYQEQIAPDPMDPLCELLEDLGPSPSLAVLLDRPADDPALKWHGRTVVCLTLVNKQQPCAVAAAAEDQRASQLLLRCKELLVALLPCLQGSTLLEALNQPHTQAQERLFHGSGPTGNLAECKRTLRTLLQRLELEGLVSQQDGYQQLLTAVAQDICKNGRYRDARRQELEKLRDAKRGLEVKTMFYQEQAAFYTQYLHTCLDNMDTTGSRKARSAQRRGRARSRPTLKYSAAKLHDKGVLLQVEGLPTSQLKNVQFEISPGDTSGIFTVCGKFMGVQMESVQLDIQELLQLQYEGATIMDMFGKAKVNVNLLLFLLNSKFYGKA